MLAGLVMCSLTLLTAFFVGRKPRPVKPFLLQSDSDTGDPAPDQEPADATAP